MARRGEAEPGRARAIAKRYQAMVRRYGQFDADLSGLWHGIIEGRCQPVSFYTAAERAELGDEVRDTMVRYARRGETERADRLERLWELVQTYIQARNEAIETGGALTRHPVPPGSLARLLELLYEGESADAYWRAYARRHHRRARKPEAFWDYFEEFQPRRMELGAWLAGRARGRILDLGSGAHSYIWVDVAADRSSQALEENELASETVRIRPLDEYGTHRWPFAPGSFDTILLNSVLAYVQDWPGLFARLRATLRTGGQLLITHAPVQAHHPATLFIAQEVEAKRLTRELERAGFVVEDDSRGTHLRLRARLTP